MDFYIDPDKQAILKANQLADFDSVWNLKAEWFEPPNERRGGWSGVNKLELPSAKTDYHVFLKRQLNHQRRTLRHPFSGVPTFLREFSMLLYLQMHGLSAPRPLLFATQRAAVGYQAILITESLTHYEPLEHIVDRMFKGSPAKTEQYALLDAVAQRISQLHRLKVQHRSLYPKHIFIRMSANQPSDVAVIDFEKSRVTIFDWYRTYIDLAALNRHSQFWTRTKRLYFFKKYLGVNKLNTWQKRLCRLVYKRSQR